MLTSHHLKSFFSSFVYTPAYTCSHIFTSVHDPPTSLRCWHGSGAVCAWWHASLLSAHVPALLTGAENPATSQDMSMTGTRAILTEDGTTAAKKLFPFLAMNVRGPALAVIRGITDMNGALAWRALTTRYAPNTAPRVQSLMSTILNAKTFPSELTACEIALDEWHENIRKWESISGDLFNVSMK